MFPSPQLILTAKEELLCRIQELLLLLGACNRIESSHANYALDDIS